jgi:hypothetical protein
MHLQISPHLSISSSRARALCSQHMLHVPREEGTPHQKRIEGNRTGTGVGNFVSHLRRGAVAYTRLHSPLLGFHLRASERRGGRRSIVSVGTFFTSTLGFVLISLLRFPSRRYEVRNV